MMEMMITQHGKKGYQLYPGGETKSIIWDDILCLLKLGLVRELESGTSPFVRIFSFVLSMFLFLSFLFPQFFLFVSFPYWCFVLLSKVIFVVFASNVHFFLSFFSFLNFFLSFLSYYFLSFFLQIFFCSCSLCYISSGHGFTERRIWSDWFNLPRSSRNKVIQKKKIFYLQFSSFFFVFRKIFLLFPFHFIFTPFFPFFL